MAAAPAPVTIQDVQIALRNLNYSVDEINHIHSGLRISLRPGNTNNIMTIWQKINNSLKELHKKHAIAVKASSTFKKRLREFQAVAGARAAGVPDQLTEMDARADRLAAQALQLCGTSDLKYKQSHLEVLEAKGPPSPGREKRFPSYVQQPAAKTQHQIQLPAGIRNVNIIIQNADQGIAGKACTWALNNKLSITTALAIGGTGLAVAQHVPALAGCVESIVGAPESLLSAATNLCRDVANSNLVKSALSLATQENVLGTLYAFSAVPTVIRKLRQGSIKQAVGISLAAATALYLPTIAQKIKTGELEETVKTVGTWILSTLSWGYFGNTAATPA